MISFLKRGVKSKLAIGCLLVINFLFSFKYLSRITELALFVALVISLFHGLLLLNVPKLSFSRITYHRFQIVFIMLFVIGASIVFSKVPMESLNVDRWSVISTFWQAALAGEYPYFAKSHMGSIPGPMPFYYVLAFPFYLIGELGYFSLLGLLILYYLFLKVQLSRNYKFLMLIFLLTSPFFLWEVAVRSNLFTSSIVIVVFLYSFVTSKNNMNTSFYVYAMIFGFLLSTRAVFVLPSIIFFMYLLRKKEITILKMIKFGSVAIFTFVLTFLPLLIQFPSEFFEMNPFIVQSSFLVPFHYSIGFLVLAFSCSFLTKSKNDLFYWSGLCLFMVVNIYMLYNLSIEGWYEFYTGKKADISYFIFCIPFFMIYLLKKNDFSIEQLE